jgi:hypothetical protein
MYISPESLLGSLKLRAASPELFETNRDLMSQRLLLVTCLSVVQG